MAVKTASDGKWGAEVSPWRSMAFPIGGRALVKTGGGCKLLGGAAARRVNPRWDQRSTCRERTRLSSELFASNSWETFANTTQIPSQPNTSTTGVEKVFFSLLCAAFDIWGMDPTLREARTSLSPSVLTFRHPPSGGSASGPTTPTCYFSSCNFTIKQVVCE